MDKNLIKLLNINTLIISGGGMKGFLFFGAIKLLFELNILNKIKFYYGTSFGGIIITCLNLGWDYDELIKFSLNFPIDCLIKMDIYSFMENYGLIPKENLEIILKKIISFKNYDENITFKELYDITSKELNLIAYSLKNNETISLNYINTPDLKIWEGIYMTIALPILVPLYQYNNDYFIDGGISENFAINRIKDNLLHTIGISIDNYKTDWNILKENIDNKNIINYLKYFLDLISMFSSRTKFSDINNTIKLSLKNINNLNQFNFSLDKNTKNNIINSGYEQSIIQIEDIINTLSKEQIKLNKFKYSF
jgi:predicted acylesterase/phospholipase RssA